MVKVRLAKRLALLKFKNKEIINYSIKEGKALGVKELLKKAPFTSYQVFFDLIKLEAIKEVMLKNGSIMSVAY